MIRERAFIGFISIILIIAFSSVSALGQKPMSNAEIEGKNQGSDLDVSSGAI